MKRFVRIVCLWNIFYFLQLLNSVLSDWSEIGKKQYRVTFTLFQIHFANGKTYNFWQILQELGKDDYDLKWAERLNDHLQAGLGFIVFNTISAGFLLAWELMKYYKTIEDWGFRENLHF